MSEVYHIIVSGLVQGVGYRFYTMGAAQNLEVAGWVRNLPSGDVEVLARIPEGRKAQFEGLLRKGPPASIVKNIQISRARETQDCPTAGFTIRR